MKNICIALLTATVGSGALAQGAPSDSIYCATGYTVYFGNGVLTEATDAYLSAHKVSQMLGREYNGEPLNYAVSYNPTGGALADLVESFEQKLAEDPTLAWQLFFRFASGEFINSALRIALEDYLNTTHAHQTAQAVASLSSPAAYSDPTVVGHASNYESALLSGKRVLIVAHSQGNLYANAVVGRLRSAGGSEYNLDALGVAAVATPANFVSTGDSYVTSDTDLVIGAVRLVSPATLPDNDFTVPLLPSGNWYGHGFREIYSNGAWGIRGHTLGVMQSSLARMSSVPVTFAGGPITATLTWSSPADIDLHTFEPISHVYYANPAGQVGYLDRDDTVGTGPEHYYAGCDNFQAGLYSFGANYYSGSGSKAVFLKLSVLGVDYPTKTIMVSTPRFSAGDNSPTIMYRVLIQETDNGGFTATVQ